MADGMPPLASWPSPCIGADEIHVWRIQLDDDRDRTADRRDAIVRTAQVRAQTRAALLRILAHYTGMGAGELCIDVDSRGKPRLRHAGAPSFNLSHTRGLALVALSAERAVGIDVEQLRPLDDADALAQRFLTPAESAAVLAVEPAGRGAAFLRTWTRKEAVLKASGHGLTVDTCRIEVGSGVDDRTVSIRGDQDPVSFRVVSLSLAPPWVGALAVASAQSAAVAAFPILRCYDLPASAGPSPDRSVP